MFGLDHLVQELREANDKLHEELGAINDTLDEVNHNLKILIDIEYEKLPLKAQRAVSEKWQKKENTD
jgi:hypothetical protein